MTKEEILKRIGEVRFWGQDIPLPHGVVTPGRTIKHCAEILPRLQLPENMTNMRVFDVGTWDGFYAFEMEKRGADVLAIDSLERADIAKMNRTGQKATVFDIGNEGFETAKEILGSNVRFKNMSVYDVSPESVGLFDVTLFLGVLYHLKYPMLAIERLASITRGTMIVESACFRTLSRLPTTRYTGGGLFNQDPTTWFIPNIPAIVRMLRDGGFPHVEVIYKTPLLPVQCLKSIWHNKSVWGRAWWNSNLATCGRVILRCETK